MDRLESFRKSYKPFMEIRKQFLETTNVEYSCFSRLPMVLGFYNDGTPYLHGKNGAMTYSSNKKTYYSRDIAAMYFSAKNMIRTLTTFSYSYKNFNLEFESDFHYLVSEIADRIYLLEDIPFEVKPSDDDEKTSSYHAYFNENLNFYGNYHLPTCLNLVYASKIFHAFHMLLEEDRIFINELKQIESGEMKVSNCKLTGIEGLMDDLFKFMNDFMAIYTRLV